MWGVWNQRQTNQRRRKSWEKNDTEEKLRSINQLVKMSVTCDPWSNVYFVCNLASLRCLSFFKSCALQPENWIEHHPVTITTFTITITTTNTSESARNTIKSTNKHITWPTTAKPVPGRYSGQIWREHEEEVYELKINDQMTKDYACSHSLSFTLPFAFSFLCVAIFYKSNFFFLSRQNFYHENCLHPVHYSIIFWCA